MSEQEKKEEEKFELDSAGQAVEYISLDQARVLAVQHAQQNNRILWAPIRREGACLGGFEPGGERRLLRHQAKLPACQWVPGVEQFTIDKTGGIELRQVISEPRPSSRRVTIGLALTAVLLAAVAATIGGLWAAGVFLSSSGEARPLVVDITPIEATRLVSADGDVTIDVAAGTTDAPSQLSFRSLTDAEIPVLPQKYRGTGKAFDLTAEAVLLKPITITVGLSAADATLAEGQEDNIVMQHHRLGAWAELPTTVDFTASTAIVHVDNLSFFALTRQVRIA